MSDSVHTTDAFTDLPLHSDLPCKDVSAPTLAALRREAATLHSLGYLLVIVVPPDESDTLTAYAVPSDTAGLRDAIANAEEGDA